MIIPDATYVQEAGLGGRHAAAAADGGAPPGHPAEVLARRDDDLAAAAAAALLADHAAGGDLRVHLRHALEADEQGRMEGVVTMLFRAGTLMNEAGRWRLSTELLPLRPEL